MAKCPEHLLCKGHPHRHELSFEMASLTVNTGSRQLLFPAQSHRQMLMEHGRRRPQCRALLLEMVGCRNGRPTTAA
jgi:hypothetical protein